MHELTVETRHRSQMIDITDRVQQLVSESGVQRGSAIVYVPHTTSCVAKLSTAVQNP